MPVKRGQCTVCRYRYPLRKDGTVQGHHGFHGHTPAPECEGSRKPPRPFDPNECGDCMKHRFSTPGLVEACFSVAIESRASGEALMWDYLVAYHENGHQEAA
jgi:hypothetical protein